MADSNTTTYSFTLPEVGASADSWGTKLNANWDKVDDLLDGSIAVNGITVTGGSIDGTAIGANSASTGEFTSVDVTGTVTADGLKSDGDIEISTTHVFGQGLGYAGNTSSAGAGTMALYDATTGGVIIDGFAPSYLADSGVVLKQSGVKGFHLKNNNDVHLYEDTGTTAKFVWDSSAESLGIGTSTPSTALHVKSSTDIATFESTSSGLYNTFTSTAGTFGYLGSGSQTVSGTATTDFGIQAAAGNFVVATGGNTERMRIDSSGNVGIGTASPTQKLDIVGSGDTYAKIGNGTYNSYFGTASGETYIGNDAVKNITFYNGSTERMRITSSGFVGINDTAPQTRLSVRTHYSYNGNSNGAIKIGNYQGNDSNSYVQGYLENMNTTRMVHGAKYYGGGNSLADSATTGSTSVSLASDHIAFTTNTGLTGGSSFKPTERARIDASGNLLVGKTSTAGTKGVIAYNTGALEAIRDGAGALFVNRLNSDGTIAEFRKDGSTVGSIGSVVGLYLSINSEGGTGYLATGGERRYAWDSTRFYPLLDNARDLGLASYRFDDIYATNGTIQTSDINEKQDIKTLDQAEQRVAVKAKTLLRKFRWKDSVAEKGDDARIHFGIMAQDLQKAFSDEGLDAGRYAMFTSATWTDEETGEEKTRMGIRYSELLAFIISAI